MRTSVSACDRVSSPFLSFFQATFASRMTNSADSREVYYSNGGSLDVRTGEVTGEGGLSERYAKAAGMSAKRVNPRKLQEDRTAGGGDRVLRGRPKDELAPAVLELEPAGPPTLPYLRGDGDLAALRDHDVSHAREPRSRDYA